MKSMIRKASLATLVACALIGTAAQAGGEVLVLNETDQAFHPYFRSKCFAGTAPNDSGWVFFGGIGARGRFGWDFRGSFDTSAKGCAKPKLEFTYTAIGAPPPADRPAVVGRMKFDPLVNFHLQAGEKLKAINLLHGDDEDDED
jgi:hypothetical protein